MIAPNCGFANQCRCIFAFPCSYSPPAHSGAANADHFTRYGHTPQICAAAIRYALATRHLPKTSNQILRALLLTIIAHGQEKTILGDISIVNMSKDWKLACSCIRFARSAGLRNVSLSRFVRNNCTGWYRQDCFRRKWAQFARIYIRIGRLVALVSSASILLPKLGKVTWKPGVSWMCLWLLRTSGFLKIICMPVLCVPNFVKIIEIAQYLYVRSTRLPIANHIIQRDPPGGGGALKQSSWHLQYMQHNEEKHRLDDFNETAKQL